MSVAQDTTHADNFLAPFNPSSDRVLQIALDMLLFDRNDRNATTNPSSTVLLVDEDDQEHAQTNEILFDLGCGDGRLLLQAVQRCPTVRCIGIERNPDLVDKAVAAIRAQLTDDEQSRIEIRVGDALNPDAAVAQEATATALCKTTNSLGTNIDSKCRGLRLRDATTLYLYLLPKGLIHVQQLLTRENMPRLRFVVTYMFRLQQWEPVRVNRTTKAMVPVFLYKV